MKDAQDTGQAPTDYCVSKLECAEYCYVQLFEMSFLRAVANKNTLEKLFHFLGTRQRQDLKVLETP